MDACKQFFRSKLKRIKCKLIADFIFISAFSAKTEYMTDNEFSLFKMLSHLKYVNRSLAVGIQFKTMVCINAFWIPCGTFVIS
jgi:hypothetical protein